MLSRCIRAANSPCTALQRGAHHYSTSSTSKTLSNMGIDRHTRVIYQGFTGRTATENARRTLEYGTNVVGGVTPGKGGQTHLGLPVFDTAKQAMENVRPHASVVFVPAELAAAAIIESIEAEVPLVVSVAEHVPIHDMLRVQEVLRSQSKTRLVGPNCPGIIAPGQCRLGIMPHKQFSPGKIGIVSKSGTLSYEAVGTTTQNGLGQSLVIGVGGDMLPGTTLADRIRFLIDHEGTEGIVVIGEIGGEAELHAADVIAEYRRGTAKSKPIIAMIAGQTAPPGKVMGHAGAILSPRDASGKVKARAMADAGAVVVPHPGMIGDEMKRSLMATA